MRTSNSKVVAAFAAFMLLGSVAIGADDPPPYVSATEAYRQGVASIKAGQTEAALPALSYAAERGVLGAQLKLARIYAQGQGIPEDTGKAFSYYQQIADQHADIAPTSPVAKFVAEAFVALGDYYLVGIPDIALVRDPSRAAGLFRHAASYFGDADAQYELARLFLTGDGVTKNVGLAANWLAAAAKKQHPASQATLGELLWRGDEFQHRAARGLALIMLAHQNAKIGGDEPKWIADLYAEAIGQADAATRKEAEAIMPQWGAPIAEAAATPNPLPGNAEPAAQLVAPASGAAAETAVPNAASEHGATGASTENVATPPTAIGLSAGFGDGASGSAALKR